VAKADQKKRQKTKEAKRPLPPLPIRELSLYEKTREDIFQQRKSKKGMGNIQERMGREGEV
jgi:hypothetical protein